MLPVCLSCSLAFMFPAGTPSNALIFETAKFKLSDMAIPGLFVKIICLAIVIGTINSWAFVIYDMDPVFTNRTAVVL
jgi:di/tricarboxylate transporter